MRYEEHKIIWLQPGCGECKGDDRLWCQDDVWGKCETCGRKPAKYKLVSPVTRAERE